MIRVRGARVHNLRSLDVDIPRDRLVVITGVSGSGKSSLAFDTIFAEGQRKYMESLSAYARQFLDQLQKPDVESIEGLPPTIAIQQRSGGHNPRSTVATITEIHDYLRVLFARCGTPTCWHPGCGRPIAATSASQIVDHLTALPDGTRIMVAAPVVRGRKGHHREVIEALRGSGIVRVRVNGTVVDIRTALGDEENPLALGRYEAHTIEAVVDRLVIAPDVRARLADSIEVALRLGQGSIVALVEAEGTWQERTFSEHFACPDHPECSLDELHPRLFSFNSPFGACGACGGLGTVEEPDEALIVPDQERSLAENAIQPWARNGPRMNRLYARLLRRFIEATGISARTPYRDLPKGIRKLLMHGSTDADGKRLGFSFEGVIPNLLRRYRETDSDAIRERLHGCMSGRPCPECRGARLRPAALHVRLGGTGIADLGAMTIDRAVAWFAALTLGREQEQIAAPLLREITSRLGFLAAVGLEYLSLDRAANTLSGGEAQRIRLATQVGSGLVGVCYVLDEPTIGLHPRDNARLVATLRRLASIGNSVLVVEHDEAMMQEADVIVDIGPGAGRHGGTVVAIGTPQEIRAHARSLTGAFLSGRRRIAAPAARRVLGGPGTIVVEGARANNLRDITAAFPLGGLICVTGVSGSGKSTLVNEILLRAARRAVHGAREVPGAHRRITGLRSIDRVVEVDQSPIGRTPRSNPATYTGIFDEIRRLFSLTTEAKIRGYQPGRFSFNVRGGRCEACEGQGVRRIEMHFLPDVFVTCEACRGRRYNPETLDVLFRGRSIADVLALTVDEAVDFFDAHSRIRTMVTCLRDVGLGYLELGQPSSTLSGGEAQRVKLAAELGTRSTGHALYVLDEPTTGLHFVDVEGLLHVLHRLADAGNTLVVIEHNLDVIRAADWIIDLGPEGGAGGGTVVVSGTPEQVAAHASSFTGRFLQSHLPAPADARSGSAPRPGAARPGGGRRAPRVRTSAG
ncbi:MAG: excinuclease ABC subunit UvrA [Phycisphaeraceae bacterium]|nr:excinuclease ABC subunit UvrA [Phycisphaeraceae bacterium]